MYTDKLPYQFVGNQNIKEDSVTLPLPRRLLENSALLLSLCLLSSLQHLRSGQLSSLVDCCKIAHGNPRHENPRTVDLLSASPKIGNGKIFISPFKLSLSLSLSLSHEIFILYKSPKMTIHITDPKLRRITRTQKVMPNYTSAAKVMQNYTSVQKNLKRFLVIFNCIRCLFW